MCDDGSIVHSKAKITQPRHTNTCTDTLAYESTARQGRTMWEKVDEDFKPPLYNKAAGYNMHHIHSTQWIFLVLHRAEYRNQKAGEAKESNLW